MSTTVSVALSTLVDRALLQMQGPDTQPVFTRLTSTIDDNDTTLTLDDPTIVNPTQWIEIGDELLLVTAKSADPVPVFTVERGYYHSTAASHTGGVLVAVTPKYPRVRVAEAVKRSLRTFESHGLPLVVTGSFNREPDLKYAELPAATRDVHRVGYMGTDGHFLELDRWEFIDFMDTAVVTTGKMLRLPRYVADTDDLIVTYRTPYRWSSFPTEPDADDTVTLYEGAEDLPVLYAVAWLLSSREIARQELEVSQEWQQGEPSRNGTSMALVRARWQEFWQTLDTARRLVPAMPLHRPYKKAPRI